MPQEEINHKKRIKNTNKPNQKTNKLCRLDFKILKSGMVEHIYSQLTLKNRCLGMRLNTNVRINRTKK